MKTIIFFLVFIVTANNIFAQASSIPPDELVSSANVDLKRGDYEEAKEYIDYAMTIPETKDRPRTLFAKAQIYVKLQTLEKYKSSYPYRDAFKALEHVVAVKPDYERSAVDGLLNYCATLYYNDGVKAYNEKKYTECIALLSNVVKMNNMNGEKRFNKLDPEVIKQYDTLTAEATITMGNSELYNGQYAEAIPLLVSAKNNAITKSPAVYQSLVETYNKQKDTTDAYAMIEEAKNVFPNEVIFRDYELNYFITTGKQDALIKKLEEASAADPNNADLLYNIATIYLGMINPAEGKRPANAEELSAKSANAFQRLLKLAPDNAGYNYNFGALYFIQANYIIEEMDAIKGSSAAELKKYDDLKAKRDALYSLSLPYFEKAYSIFSVNEHNLTGEDMKNYRTTLLALSKIYAVQSKLEQSSEMKKKYDAMN